MKSPKILVIALQLIAAFLGAQQVDTIWWEDKTRYMLIDEQSSVWIFHKKGRPIKSAIIKEIDLQRGRIIYKRGGVLHDAYIQQIDKITPGENYKEVIVFANNQTPIGKKVVNYYAPSNDSFFKWNEVERVIVNTTSPNHISEEKKNLSPEPNLKADSLYSKDGPIYLVKVISINPEKISYRRVDIPDGPVYNLNTVGAKIRMKNGIYTIDFRNNKK